MTEILNQLQVNSLLEGGRLEAVRDIEVGPVPFSFLHPGELSGAAAKAIEAFQLRWAEQVSESLTRRFRTQVEVVPEGSEQIPYAAFLQAIGSASCSFEIELAGMVPAKGVLDFGQELAAGLLHRLFGGGDDEFEPRRRLTQIEVSVLRGLGDEFLDGLRAAWVSADPISPRISRYLTEVDSPSASESSLRMLVVGLRILLPGSPGRLSLCVSSSAIETLAGGTRPDPGATAPSAKEEERRLIESRLLRARVRLCVRLPAVLLKTGEIARLVAGATIQTPHRIDSRVEILVNGRPRFQGSIGQLQRCIGTRIVGEIDDPGPERPYVAKEGRIL